MNTIFAGKMFWVGLAAAGVLAGTLFLAHVPLPGLPCLVRLFTGIPCPGCGLTRSLIEVWHGDPVTSFRYHPLGLPLFVFCALLLFALLLHRSPRLEPAAKRRLWSGIGALFVGVWALRLALFMAGHRFFLW